MTGVNNSVLYTWKLLWAQTLNVLTITPHPYQMFIMKSLLACHQWWGDHSLPKQLLSSLDSSELDSQGSPCLSVLCAHWLSSKWQVVGVFKPRSSDSRVCVLEATPNSWFLLASSVAFSWTVLHPVPKSDLVKMQMDPVYVTSLHETLQWLLPGFRFNKAPLPVPTGSPTWSPVASLWTSAPSHQLLASLGSLHLLGFAEPCPCLALHKPASFSAFRDTFSGMPALIPPTLRTSLCGLDSLLAWVTAPCWCPLSQPHNLPPFPFIGWFPCLWPSSPTSLWAPRGEGACSSLCPTPSNQHNAWPIAGN